MKFILDIFPTAIIILIAAFVISIIVKDIVIKNMKRKPKIFIKTLDIGYLDPPIDFYSPPKKEEKVGYKVDKDGIHSAFK